MLVIVWVMILPYEDRGAIARMSELHQHVHDSVVEARRAAETHQLHLGGV